MLTVMLEDIVARRKDMLRSQGGRHDFGLQLLCEDLNRFLAEVHVAHMFGALA